MDRQLKIEEDNFTLTEITKLTQEGIMKWNCETPYYSIGFETFRYTTNYL